MLDEHFADMKPHPATRYADFVVSDDRGGGGPAPDASAIIKRFKEEEFPRILVSVNMLDTGLRLSGGGQPRHGTVHEERHPLPTDARTRHTAGSRTSARPTSRSLTSWA